MCKRQGIYLGFWVSTNQTWSVHSDEPESCCTFGQILGQCVGTTTK